MMIALKILDPRQPDVAREHLLREAIFLERFVQLNDAASNGPLRLRLGECRLQLVAVDPVASRVRASPFEIGDRTPGDYFLHDGCDVPDLIVLGRVTDVERLIVDDVPWGLENCEKGPRNVARRRSRSHCARTLD